MDECENTLLTNDYTHIELLKIRSLKKEERKYVNESLTIKA
jgi:hypothetical protein